MILGYFLYYVLVFDALTINLKQFQCATAKETSKNDNIIIPVQLQKQHVKIIV